MATLTEYFDSEARDCLAHLDRDLERTLPDTAALHRSARALRGTAQMAREDRVVRAAFALEAGLRAVLDHTLAWSDDVANRTRESVASLRVLVDRRADHEALDAAADAVVSRWRDLGIAPAFLSTRTAPHGASASREFRAFVAREVTGIAEALDRGVQQLTAAPMDREPLKMILRRQRALLGAARLDEIPVVAEILRAIDDLTRVIAKLDVGVKREWLDIYRVAREALKAAIEPLQRDEDPPPSHSLSRLRHMREELLERYGAGEAVSAAHESQGFTRATTVMHVPGPVTADDDGDTIEVQPSAIFEVAPPAEDELLLEDEVVLELREEDIIADAGPESAPAAAEPDVVPIESLVYGREDALRRALELYDVVARVSATDPTAREAVDELFDLIHIALR